jgi:hypothetical protein
MSRIARVRGIEMGYDEAGRGRFSARPAFLKVRRLT